jgi:hypothetical protein
MADLFTFTIDGSGCPCCGCGCGDDNPNCNAISAGDSGCADSGCEDCHSCDTTGTCIGVAHDIGTYTNPISGPAIAYFVGNVNDDLLWNGSVVASSAGLPCNLCCTEDPSTYNCAPGDTQGPCPCACAHDITCYAANVAEGASVDIGVQNNFDNGWSIAGLGGTGSASLCFCPGSLPP